MKPLLLIVYATSTRPTNLEYDLRPQTSAFEPLVGLHRCDDRRVLAVLVYGQLGGEVDVDFNQRGSVVLQRRRSAKRKLRPWLSDLLLVIVPLIVLVCSGFVCPAEWLRVPVSCNRARCVA